jgi:hypothetical protein
MAIPTKEELAKYNITIPEIYEGLTQSLYDFQSYAAAGATQFTFFQLPIGQSSKTADDTNMVLAGQIPAQQIFLIQSCEVPFYPTVPAVTADNPAAFGAQAVANIVNDVYKVYHAGNFLLTIGSKTYLQEAPIGRLPPKTHFQLNAALSDTSTIAADKQSRIAFAYAAGRPYMLAAPLKLAPQISFSVTLNFATAVSVTNPARVGVILDGVMYRQAQ